MHGIQFSIHKAKVFLINSFAGNNLNIRQFKQSR